MENLRFAVFGNPIKHSYSPKMHHLFAEQCGLTNFSYVKTLVEENSFEKTVQDFFNQGGIGLNITVPFKLRAFQLANKLTPRAKAAGAVNTLWFQEGLIHGDNTDGVGLVKDIIRLGVDISSKRILLIGAGGASRGVILPLIEAGCRHLHIANRTASKAQTMIDSFAPLLSCSLTASGLEDITGSWDIIINASASSLSNEEIPVPSHIFSNALLAYDMLYTPSSNTAFLSQATKYGARLCSDGLGMLVYQGAEAFFIWNKQYPNPEPVLNALRHDLLQHA